MRVTVSSRTAFTLVELLAVMAIMAVLLGLAASSLLKSQSGMEISTGAALVEGVLNQGRQIAQSNNKYTQVRFYKNTEGGTTGYRGIGLFTASSPYYKDYDLWTKQGAFQPADKAQFLPGGLMVVAEGSGAQFLVDLSRDKASDGSFYRNGTSTVSGRSYEWVAFYFRPNGTTDFQSLKLDDTAAPQTYSSKLAFFTLVQQNIYQRTQPRLPANFATFCLSPANGRFILVRP